MRGGKTPQITIKEFSGKLTGIFLAEFMNTFKVLTFKGQEKNDPRLPFGLPGVNKKQKIGNGNYIWISYFYSYLNEKGGVGFVMSSQASSAGNSLAEDKSKIKTKEKNGKKITTILGKDEALLRKSLIETKHVDVMISIRSNFFYTRSVPCELWFFDKGKPNSRLDKVLMIDARNVYHQVKLSEKEINELLILLKPCYSLLCFFSSQIKSSEETNNVKDLINSLVKEIEDFVLELEIESSKGQADETKYLLTEPNRSILLNSIKTIENNETIVLTNEELNEKILSFSIKWRIKM